MYRCVLIDLNDLLNTKKMYTVETLAMSDDTTETEFKSSCCTWTIS